LQTINIVINLLKERISKKQKQTTSEASRFGVVSLATSKPPTDFYSIKSILIIGVSPF